jgi:hypothetical protein
MFGPNEEQFKCFHLKDTISIYHFRQDLLLLLLRLYDSYSYTNKQHYRRLRNVEDVAEDDFGLVSCPG